MQERPHLVARIQAHPSRRELAESLALDLADLPTEISYHSSDPPSPWAGYQLALQSGLQTEATHILVIQEDAKICRNLAGTLLAIAKAKPDDPVSLFLSWLPVPEKRDALQAMIDGRRYIRSIAHAFCPVVAILWPVGAAADFLAWTSSGVKLPNHHGLVASDDAVLARWRQRCERTIWITVPSLVEHPDTNLSVKGRQNALWGKDRGRIALQWIGAEEDPLELDW